MRDPPQMASHSQDSDRHDVLVQPLQSSICVHIMYWLHLHHMANDSDSHHMAGPTLDSTNIDGSYKVLHAHQADYIDVMSHVNLVICTCTTWQLSSDSHHMASPTSITVYLHRMANKQ